MKSDIRSRFVRRPACASDNLMEARCADRPSRLTAPLRSRRSAAPSSRWRRSPRTPSTRRRRPPRETAPMKAAMAEYRKKLAAYTKAYDAFEKIAGPYWRDVTDKRSRRRTKVANNIRLTADDYVMTQPPVYTGPDKPENPLHAGKKQQRHPRRRRTSSPTPRPSSTSCPRRRPTRSPTSAPTPRSPPPPASPRRRPSRSTASNPAATASTTSRPGASTTEGEA